MSQENVEVVRRFLRVEEALRYAEPDIVWNPVVGLRE
jgi:hypothetical protein